MKFYVYILLSDSLQRFYIGQTKDIHERFKRHNAGREAYTSKGIPWKLVYVQEMNSRKEAMALEKKIKNLKSNSKLLQFIEGQVSMGRGSRKI
jgi:putative endonuclease